ncbi:hypothetical protein VTN02DRAFT_152 [Thermoascus thermophilus]
MSRDCAETLTPSRERLARITEVPLWLMSSLKSPSLESGTTAPADDGVYSLKRPERL